MTRSRLSLVFLLRSCLCFFVGDRGSRGAWSVDCCDVSVKRVWDTERLCLDKPAGLSQLLAWKLPRVLIHASWAGRLQPP